ncbi:MAG: DUF2490 domain-containing protein [Janthinobacterium lividum]
MFVSRLAAQSSDPSGGATKSAWYMYFGNHPVTNNWSIHLEGQYRREGVGQRWEQLLVRPGVERKLGHGMTALVAYTYLRDYPFEGGSLGETTTTGPQPEHRILEEFKWKHPLIGSGKQAITLTHRFRAEQRFEGTSTTDVGTTQWDFAERARYRLTANIPFRWNTGGIRPDYASVYDEVFVNFGPHGTDNALNQNRVYSAMGWNLSQHSQLEIGYMEQYSPVPNGIVNVHNHALQVTIYSTAPLKKLFGARP